jgi:imidazole glycerol-phosphate synthase subunit HisH
MSIIHSISPITIVDYQSGNIASVANMIRRIGGNVIISKDEKEIASASKLILPGVGAFDHGIEQLHYLGLFSVIKNKIADGTPLLGICLGMQLLAKQSEEGTLQGFGVIDAEFRRFSANFKPGLRVPHVGWNYANIVNDNALLKIDTENQNRFYFTHSYYAVCNDNASILATTSYGHDFPSIYFRENVYGVQFHPEKSHRFGMKLVRNFMDI